MKQILLVCVFFIIVLSMASCIIEPKIVVNGRSLYEMYFKKTLKDPNSFKVYNEKYSNLGDIVVWTLDYGAKNSLGGMDRETIEFRTSNKNLQINGNEYLIDDLK